MMSDGTRPADVGIVGDGRMGRALARALSSAGVPVHGPWGRGANADELPVGAVVLLSVPDGEVANAARCVRAGLMIGHCAGALTLEPLGDREGFSMHPLLTVTAKTTDFSGAWCAVTGSSVQASETAAGLARRMGMHVVQVADGDRALYHAAASLAANHLVSVLDAAEHAMQLAGVPRDALAPLAHAAVGNWAARGGEAALTGPVMRRDEETVERQREAVRTRVPELLSLWDALTTRTRALAERARRRMER